MVKDGSRTDYIEPGHLEELRELKAGEPATGSSSAAVAADCPASASSAAAAAGSRGAAATVSAVRLFSHCRASVSAAGNFQVLFFFLSRVATSRRPKGFPP